MIAVGDRVPEGTLLEMTADGPAQVEATALLGSGKVALFGVPGAFTPTCSNTHLPSFINGMEALAAKGVGTVVCLSANDPFVMGAWGKASGAADAGIRMVGDPDGSYAAALGLDFSAPPVGLHNRSRRFAALIEDGAVSAIVVEANPGQAVETTAEALLAHL